MTVSIFLLEFNYLSMTEGFFFASFLAGSREKTQRYLIKFRYKIYAERQITVDIDFKRSHRRKENAFITKTCRDAIIAQKKWHFDNIDKSEVVKIRVTSFKRIIQSLKLNVLPLTWCRALKMSRAYHEGIQHSPLKYRSTVTLR